MYIRKRVGQYVIRRKVSPGYVLGMIGLAIGINACWIGLALYAVYIVVKMAMGQ